MCLSGTRPDWEAFPWFAVPCSSISGKKIGRRYDDSISSGQALGQKNTVFAIWMGYTFFTPVTAVAAGFYSVWHNVVNSYQLYLQRKSEGESDALKN